MGKIGVKVWVFKGDLMPGEKADQNIKTKKPQSQGKEGAPRLNRRKRSEDNASGTEA